MHAFLTSQNSSHASDLIYIYTLVYSSKESNISLVYIQTRSARVLLVRTHAARQSHEETTSKRVAKEELRRAGA